MEDFICRTCANPADLACICDKNPVFCFKDFAMHTEIESGHHKSISLSKIRFERTCKASLKKINQVKNELINKSEYLIRAIKSITKNHLSKLLENSSQIKRLQSKEDYSDNSNKEVESYGYVDIKQVLLDDFNEIAKSYLCILSNGIVILPSKFNIDEAIKEAKARAEKEAKAREAKEAKAREEKEAKARAEKEAKAREEKEAKARVEKEEFTKRSEELLNSIEPLDRDFNNMKNEIECYFQMATEVEINDRVDIENTLKTIVHYNEIFKQAKNDLRKAVNLEISVAEMISINNHAFNLIRDLNDISQSCKSFLAMFKELSSNCMISGNFLALKITNDKQYYFLCNF